MSHPPESESSLASAHQILDILGIPGEGEEGSYTIVGRIEILRQSLAIEAGLKVNDIATAARRFQVSGNHETLASWNALFQVEVEKQNEENPDESVSVNATPVYIGSTYLERESSTYFVVISLSHPHDKLADPPFVIFQHKSGQEPNSERSHYLPITEFCRRFEYVS